MQTKLYVNLSTNLALHNSNTVRAYTVWSWLRSDEPQNYYLQTEVTARLVELTGRSKQTIDNWFKAGYEAGFFVKWSNGRFSTVNKMQLFERYLAKNERSGIVVLVDTEKLLTGSLAEVRATIFGLQFVKKSKWISRSKLQVITKRTDRTQRRYDKLNQQPKRYTYLVNSVEVKQMPNMYSRAKHYFTAGKRRRLRARGHNSCESSNSSLKIRSSYEQECSNDLSEKRLLFDKPEDAIKASNRRDRKNGNPMTFSIKRDVRRVKKARRYNHLFIEAHYSENY